MRCGRLLVAAVLVAIGASAARAELLPNGVLHDGQTSIVSIPELSTFALFAVFLGMLAYRSAALGRGHVQVIVGLSWLALFALPVSAGQIPLTPESVIGGSGAWSEERWDSGPLRAGLVADNQGAFRITEPDHNSGDANGGMWLGKEDDEEEFFVLDLGREYRIGAVALFQTHDARFNDRSTNGYEIYGASAVVPINTPDESPAGGMDLLDPVLIGSGSLRRQMIEDDPIEPEWVELQPPLSCIRYVRINTVGPLHNGQIARQRGVGLNEIKVFSYFPDLRASDADMDLDSDQLDLVKALQAAKYLTGQPATWGEGDWNGAPGGEPGRPPVGDGVFNQLDIVAAQQAGLYLTGSYAAAQGDTFAVPEPSGIALTVLGLFGLLACARRRVR